MILARENLLSLTMMAILVALAHFSCLSVFYVQDDAHALLVSAGWKDYYLTAHTALQYRPNAWLVTYLLDQFTPDKPWALRFAGMLVLWLTGVLVFFLIRALARDRFLANSAGFLTVVHPSFYSYNTLYLSAVMTGLGLIFVLIGALGAYYCAKSSPQNSRYFSVLTALFLILALTSYEAAIITLPLMMGIDYLYSNNAKILCCVKRYIPHIIITLLYLYLRSMALSNHASTDADSPYVPQLDNISYNLRFIWHSFLGLDIAGPTLENKIIGGCTAGLAFVGGTLYAVWSKQWRLWIGAFVWLALGASPFLLAGHMSLHYAVYAVVGYLVFLAMGITWLGIFNRHLRMVFLAIAVFSGISANYKAYSRNVLISMAQTGENIVEQIRSFNLENKNIILMNMDNHLAWRIYGGESFNIDFRDNPYLFVIPQGNWNSQLDIENPTALFVENFLGDVADLRTKLHDVTSFYNPDGPGEEIELTEKDSEDNFIWKPSHVSGPITVIASDDAMLEAHLGDLKCIVEGNKNAMAFPPKEWGINDHITLSSNEDVPNIIVKNGFALPKGNYSQICTDSLFE